MRKAYVLTVDSSSERAVFSKKVLDRIGFDVELVTCIPNDDKVLSNKLSMQHIYRRIKNSDMEYAYVFEDDINVLEDIQLDEILQYESISERFFYLGLCEISMVGSRRTPYFVNGHSVISKSGNVRGLHAIGLSRKGAAELLDFSEKSARRYMDMILEDFSMVHPANVVRYDLESYIRGHRGVIFQDRRRFPSSIP